MLTGQRDSDLVIFENLDDRDLFNLCQVNTYTKKLCQNETFWRNRFFKKFGPFNQKNKDKTWKRLYLQVVYFFDKYFLDKAMAEVVKIKEKDLIEFFISKGANNWNWGLFEAVRVKDRDLIEFFISKEPKPDPNAGLSAAISIEDWDLINFFISKGAEDWQDALVEAAATGNRELVDFFISKVGDNWGHQLDYALDNASSNQHWDIAKLLLEKGANPEYGLSGSAYSGNKEMVDFFLEEGAENLNLALQMASAGNQKEMIDYLFFKGANDLNSGLIGATIGQNLDLINFFIEKGADDLEGSLRESVRRGNKKMIEFFEKKIK